MKIYSKKNNGLRLLGEGRVFSKKQLVLKEDGITLTSTASTTPGQALSTAPSVLSKAPTNTKSIVIPNNQLDGNPKDNGPTLKLNKSTAQTADGKRAANNFVKQNPDFGSVEIENDNGNTQTLNNSVAPRKVMDEMRKNSIPFTKSELTRFLKTI